MEVRSQEAIRQLQALMDHGSHSLFPLFFAPICVFSASFLFLKWISASPSPNPMSLKKGKNVHQGYLAETLERFLKARDWNVSKAYKMLLDCLNWRVENEIDMMLTKPIIPVDVYRAVRDSQLIGLSGYSREGLPVFAIGVGLSTFDKASVNYYVQSHIQINEYRDRVILPSASKKYGRPITTCVKVLDMTGLKLSSLSQIKLLTIISTIDDLNYPEKTNTYFIVNAPYIFSSCWKIMDYSSLPHFCKREGSGSSRHSSDGDENCYSLDHPFHQQLYNYIKQQAVQESSRPIKQGSVHVSLPEPPADGAEIVKTIELELHK
ncbi:Protein real-time [Cucurbita argyrosperma subsp. argyrosperma]|nr:Protein real-time [Cucurbita argyrosperma subsp. argyrosperma]